MKKLFCWLLTILILAGTVQYVTAQTAKTRAPGLGLPGIDKNKVRVINYELSWKGNTLTNRDTVITQLTGAAQAYDTTDAFYNVAGFNTMSLMSIWQAVQDSALGIIYMDVSNDGTNWAAFPVVNDTLGAGVDSSGARVIGTTVRLKSIASVPPCELVRFRFRKYLSAATDTMRYRGYLWVTFNDE